MIWLSNDLRRDSHSASKEEYRSRIANETKPTKKVRAPGASCGQYFSGVFATSSPIATVCESSASPAARAISTVLPTNGLVGMVDKIPDGGHQSLPANFASSILSPLVSFDRSTFR